MRNGTASVYFLSMSPNRDWDCTVDPARSLRIGLRYICGLREEAGRAIETARKSSPFKSIDDL